MSHPALTLGRASRPAARAKVKPTATTTNRKDFTDRLGQPANATDAQVLAAVDTMLTNRAAAHAAKDATADTSPNASAWVLAAVAQTSPSSTDVDADADALMTLAGWGN